MQQYTDLTVRLDELYAKGAFSEFTPNVSDTAKQVRAATAKNINERGGFYLSNDQIPMNFASDDFGANAGADFGDAGKVTYLKQVVTALKRTSSVKWQDEVEVQSGKPELMQRPGKSTNDKLSLVAGHLKAYAVSWSRELWGDRTNEMARVSAINTTTKVVTCANAGNLFGVFNLHIGQELAIHASNGTQRTGNQGYITVTAVNPANRTFSYASTAAHPQVQVAPSGIIDGDILYPAQKTLSMKDKALAGIRHLLGTSGAYQGVSDRTSNQMLCGTYVPGNGNVISAAFLRKMKSTQKYQLLGGKRTKGTFYASAQVDGYEATELGKQSYAQDGATMKKGYRRLYFDESPFETEFYVARDAVAYVDLSKIDRFGLKEYGPIKDGAGYELRAPSSSGGTYQGNKMILFQGYEQLGCEVPKELGVYSDGLSTAGVAMGYTS